MRLLLDPEFTENTCINESDIHIPPKDQEKRDA